MEEADVDIDALDAGLARISDGLAEQRRFEDLAPGMRALVRRPYLRLAQVLILALSLIATGYALGDERPRAWGVVLLIVLLPERIQAARKRARASVSMDEKLFEQCEEDAWERFVRTVVNLLLSLPLALALLLLGALSGRDSLLWAALAVTLSLPFQFFFGLRRAAVQHQLAKRWAELEHGDSKDENPGDHT